MIEPCFGKSIFTQRSYTKKHHYLTRCVWCFFFCLYIYFLLETINAVGRVVFYRCIIYSRLLFKVICDTGESPDVAVVSLYFFLVGNEQFYVFWSFFFFFCLIWKWTVQAIELERKYDCVKVIVCIWKWQLTLTVMAYNTEEKFYISSRWCY